MFLGSRIGIANQNFKLKKILSHFKRFARTAWFGDQSTKQLSDDDLAVVYATYCLLFTAGPCSFCQMQMLFGNKELKDGSNL